MAGEIFDPQETDPRLRTAFAEADVLAEYSVRNVPRDRRFVFKFWLAKKAILKQKHGIAWRTPAELNPNITYEAYGQPAVTARERCEISAMMDRQLRGKYENVVSIERTFYGTINVWTKVGNTDERGQYTVAKTNGRWKIVDRQRVLP